jgi:ribonuclease HI
MSREEIIMYSDGASRGNPGEASLGVYIETLGKEYSEYIGKATNNEAEYRALVYGLKKIKVLLGKKEAKQTNVLCYLDSELVVKQLNHIYKIEHKTTQKYFLEVWNLVLDFSTVRFEHIPREENKKADSLANLALDTRKQKSLL